MKLMMMMTAVLLAGGAWAKDVDWERDYDTALEKAKKEKKLVMIDLYTDWCGWCKKLDKDTYSDKDVQAKLAREFIAVKINPEKSAKNQKISRDFGTRSFPHIVFTDAAGKKIDEIGGYMGPADFATALDEVKKKVDRK